MTDRAQSETMGYVLVFSLIMLTIGAVYVGGFNAIDDSQQDAEINNMERAFDVLADNVRDIYSEGAPRRATEIKVGGGSLTHRNVTSIEFSVVDPGDPSHNATFSTRRAGLDSVVYETDSTNIIYTNGAVIRSNGRRAAMATEPRWVVSEERTVIPIVITTARSQSLSIPGPTTLLVRSRAQSRGVGTVTPRASDHVRVNVTVTSPHTEAWADYFEGQGFDHVAGSVSADSVTYSFETERFTAVQTEIAVSLHP